MSFKIVKDNKVFKLIMQWSGIELEYNFKSMRDAKNAADAIIDAAMKC